MRVQETLAALRALEKTLNEAAGIDRTAWLMFNDLVKAARTLAEIQPGTDRKLLWKFKQLQSEIEQRLALADTARQNDTI